MVALRTIHNLWRYEQQNQNAQIIADKAAKLYDKVRLFLGEMDALGSALDKANSSYQSAVIKLSQGRGNLLRQTESFKELGVDVKQEIKQPRFEQNLPLSSFVSKPNESDLSAKK